MAPNSIWVNDSATGSAFSPKTDTLITYVAKKISAIIKYTTFIDEKRASTSAPNIKISAIIAITVAIPEKKFIFFLKTSKIGVMNAK